jgi:RNA polymerase sigma factor for flagellar operon FliA
MTNSEILKQYTPLVRRIAGGFIKKLPRNVLRDDIIAAGMFGLWDAILKNDGKPLQGSFDWYVRIRIRGAILDELRLQDWLPRRTRATVTAAKKEGREASFAIVPFDNEHMQHVDALSVEANETAAAAQHAENLMLEAIEKLPVRERYVVSKHYFQGVKFKDLSVELGVSEPRISQLHSRAMERLRDMAVHSWADDV